MNAEVIKAMNKKEKKHTVRKWWYKNEYKVMRVILFPVWFGILAKTKIDAWLDSRNKWSEERTQEILNYYIPRKAEWDEEEKTFYFFDNGYGWSNLSKKYVKRKDHRFWYNHKGFWGGDIRIYLIEKFELKGFSKEIGNCDQGRTEISFRMIENPLDK